MAQINLLKQSAPQTDLWEKAPHIIVKFLAVALLLTLAGYGWLYVSAKQEGQKIVSQQQQLSDEQNKALGMKNRDELLTRQQQLKEYSGLVDKQIYWSQLMPVLASSTLKTAVYNSLKVTPDGRVDLDVSVPTLQDLDKYLQVFDLPEYNKNFNNVRISSFSKVQNAKGTQIRFEVSFNYNPDIIKPKP